MCHSDYHFFVYSLFFICCFFIFFFFFFFFFSSRRRQTRLVSDWSSDVCSSDLHTDAVDTELLLIDLGCGKNRLGGSILAQTFAAGYGTECPDVDEPALLKAFFAAIQALRPLILAYHDRSDGGLFATVCEMACAGHCGVTINIDPLAFDAATDDVDAFKRNADEQL